MPSPYRIASRFHAAKTFQIDIGTVVLYGKYKNKKGRVVDFKKGPKGDQIVVVEPIPKGRKQNKDLKLFTIRKAPEEE